MGRERDMGLFNGWFASKERDAGPANMDYRKTPRRRVATAWPPIEARFGESKARVLDLTDRGFGLRVAEDQSPERALVDIVRGDDLVQRGYAMRVWRENGRAGYAFAGGLIVERIQEQREARAAAINDRKTAAPSKTAGPLSKESLRARLKL